MRTPRFLFFAGFFLITISTITSAQSQILKVDSLLANQWVDSVFNSLSMTEKVNQLLVINLDLPEDDMQDPSINFGGILINDRSPESYRKRVAAQQNTQRLKPLVFHELGDPFGLKIDSIDQFGDLRSLSLVDEPHLFYETGTAIANQCKVLGISAVLNGGFDLLQLFKEKSWKLSELNQGLIDNKIIPIDAIIIHDYSKDSLSFIEHLFSWDMIALAPDQVFQFHQSVQEAISNEQLSFNDLEKKCKWVLANKKWAGFDKNNSVPADKQYELLNNPNNVLLLEEMAKFSLVVIGGTKVQIPIIHLENNKIAHLSIGQDRGTDFNEYVNKYTQVDYFETDYISSDESYAGLWTELNAYDMLICTYYNLDKTSGSDDDHEGFLIFQEWISKSGKSLPVAFLNESRETNYNILNVALSGIIVYGDNQILDRLAPQLIFGGIEAHGKLPFAKGTRPIGSIGKDVNSLNRFSYTLPEAVGLDGGILNRIDTIAVDAIRKQATPGCQILVAKGNKVVYQKSFGYHTYDSLQAVSNDDLYDLASLTKVSGALPALMKLYQEGKFDLEATMGTYLPYFKRGNKKTLTYREILAHQSGLNPYIVYWQTAIKKNGKFKRKTLSHEKNEAFSYEISAGLYLHNDYKKKIYKQIKKSKLGDKKYSYSGLSFLLYPEIIETIAGQGYEEYLSENFYNPLGATSLTYNPLLKFNIDRITPTEYDSLFRKTQIQGQVHDEAAAVMSGVSSNAGLFGNANDLAKLFQMYCNYGTYGNREYLNEETLMEFTRCQYPEDDNRRGLGFDRPLPEPHENGNTAKSVSQLSFGHSGFTGTFAWVDPQYNLVYIFLSNRVYPTRNNRKLYEMNVRTNIQEVIYEAMEMND